MSYDKWILHQYSPLYSKSYEIKSHNFKIRDVQFEMFLICKQKLFQDKVFLRSINWIDPFLIFSVIYNKTKNTNLKIDLFVLLFSICFQLKCYKGIKFIETTFDIQSICFLPDFCLKIYIQNLRKIPYLLWPQIIFM